MAEIVKMSSQLSYPKTEVSEFNPRPQFQLLWNCKKWLMQDTPQA